MCPCLALPGRPVTFTSSEKPLSLASFPFSLIRSRAPSNYQSLPPATAASHASRFRVFMPRDVWLPTLAVWQTTASVTIPATSITCPHATITTPAPATTATASPKYPIQH